MEELGMNCRFCNNPMLHTFTDLGDTPLANSFLTSDMLDEKEQQFPLKSLVCTNCFLVQVDEFENPQIRPE